jgi:hypothetical protein
MSETPTTDRAEETPMHATRLAKVGVLALLLGYGGAGSPLWAGEARLVEEADPKRLVIETTDASVDEVLAVLATHFEFAVERGASSDRTVRFSGRLQGSLDQLLERLLRHEGHMIVRSAETRGGISRVVLLEGKSGSPDAPTVAGPIAALKAKLESQGAQRRR